MGCFKPSVIFSPDSAAPELADTTTRRRLRLTATEARVLAKFDGSQTAKELALWAANEGLAIGPLQLQVMLERLERAGFLLSAPHVPPQDARDVGFAATDDPLSLAHIVPSMRNDLKIVPSLGSRSTYDVSDPLAHRSFTLYDFEVSIARMLDGRRNAGQVIEASAKIGIPVTLESLRRFLLQLKAFKFLSAEPADLAKRGPRSTWPMRADWTEDLRQLFQNALRLLRSGKLPEAREFLLAMLEIDAMNKEGQETKARVDELIRDPIVEITFADLHAEPASSTGALLDSHLRVPVALPPPEPIEPQLLSVGARPTAPEMPVVEPELSPSPLGEGGQRPGEGPDELLPVAPSQPLLAAIEDIQVEESTVPVESMIPSPLGEGGQRPGEGPDELLPVATLEPEPIASPEPEPVASPPVEEAPSSSAGPSSALRAPSPRGEGDPEPFMPSSLDVPQLATEVPPPSEVIEAPPRKSRWRRVLILLLLAGIGGLLAYPLPRTQVIPCELSPVVVATVTAPRPGTIEELSVSEGQLVEKGQALATLSTKGSAAELERLRARATALERQLDQLAKSVKPAEVAKAREALAAKTKELAQATEQKRRLEAKHAPAAAIGRAEKEVRAKQALVDKATEQLVQVSQEEKLGTGRQVVEGLKRESAQLQSEIAQAHVVAPEAGRIEGLVGAGAVLADHAELARLVSPATLTVVAHNPVLSAAIDPAGATLSTGAGPGTIVSDLHWVKDGAEPQLSGTLTDPALKPGPATLKISLGKRAWGLELYERAQAMVRSRFPDHPTRSN